MRAFLTSNPMNMDGICLNEKNVFLERLISAIGQSCKALFICSDPDSYEKTTNYGNALRACFENSGIYFTEFSILDGRNKNMAHQLVSDADLIVLLGGHVPTQNKFFHEIRLKELLQVSHAVFVGFSAGSMNMAESVYAHPEREGEAASKNYNRFLHGLGITKTMIIPHYQKIKNDILDGKRVFEDIAYPDSEGRQFIALVDGSYIEIVDHAEILYGEAYLIKDGVLSLLNEENAFLRLQ